MSSYEQEAKQRRRRKLADLQDNVCPACKSALPEDLSDTEIDHVIPKSRGGPNKAWNYRLLHTKCNRRKRVKITAEAEALAAEHGLTITPPRPQRPYWRRGPGWWPDPGSLS